MAAKKRAMIGASIGLDGEKEFKQAITGINSDMKVLASEMKKATSEFKDNANSVTALTTKSKVLNDQIVAQKSKVEELRKALENSTKQYGENDKRTKDWKISLNNAEAQLNDLNSELKTNDKYLDEAQRSTKGLATSIDSMGKEADSTGTKTLKMGDIIKANLISSAIINGLKAVASAMKDIAMEALNSADEIATLAQQTGFTITEIQQLKYAGIALDTDLEVLTGSMTKMIRAMKTSSDSSIDSAEALLQQQRAAMDVEKAQVAITVAVEKYGVDSLQTRDATLKYNEALSKQKTILAGSSDAFKKLGINIKNSDGSLRDSKKVMFEAIDALGKMTNETERDAMAMAIFGKSAMELNPLIKAGSAELTKLMQAAIDNGAVMSDATVNGLDGFKDDTELLKMEIQALVGGIVSELMPTFREMIQWVRDNKEEIKKFAIEAIQKVVDTIDWFIKNKDAVVLAIGAIGTAFLLASGPVATLAAGLGLIILNWGNMNGAERLITVLGGVAVAASAAAIAVGALQSAWSLGIAAAAIVAGVLAISYAINSATKRDFQKAQTSGSGAGGSGGGHWNAEGGIFTKPTMFATPAGYQGVGEAGAEAILPLSKLPSMVGQMIDYDMMADAMIRAQRRVPAVAIMEKSDFVSGVEYALLKAV